MLDKQINKNKIDFQNKVRLKMINLKQFKK